MDLFLGSALCSIDLFAHSFFFLPLKVSFIYLIESVRSHQQGVWQAVERANPKVSEGL